jgi:hypothetical protein
MKKELLTIFASFGMVVTGLMAQDPVLIIDENFQDWPATEEVKSGDQIIDLSGYSEGTYILWATDRQKRRYTKKFTTF